jgi:hypothetical protein
MRANNRGSQGCTLVELSIALVIFLVGLIALLQFLVVAFSVNQRNRDTTMATALAQAKADELLRLGFEATEQKPGGVLPADLSSHPLASPNPEPLKCYTDFFTHDGGYILGPPSPCNSGGGKFQPPTISYFVRQWQISNCDSSCGSAQNRCDSSCDTGKMKKITVTVTALSPFFRGNYASATVVVYSSSLN